MLKKTNRQNLRSKVNKLSTFYSVLTKTNKLKKVDKMQIKEFRAKVKDLAEKHGIKRKKVTIIFTEGARIIITCNNLEIFKNLKSKILQLAKFENKIKVINKDGSFLTHVYININNENDNNISAQQ